MRVWTEGINSFLHETKEDEINIMVGFIIYGNN